VRTLTRYVGSDVLFATLAASAWVLVVRPGAMSLAYFWDEADVNARLHKVITRAFEDVVRVAEERGVNLREAAMLLGVGRVVEATTMRGIYP